VPYGVCDVWRTRGGARRRQHRHSAHHVHALSAATIITRWRTSMRRLGYARYDCLLLPLHAILGWRWAPGLEESENTMIFKQVTTVEQWREPRFVSVRSRVRTRV
jgi:hypothetical protein